MFPKNLKLIFLSFSSTIIVLFYALPVFAITDLSMKEDSITLSKSDILSGENVRIYARVFNYGDVDVFGYIVFLIGEKEIGSPQVVSIRQDSYDDVFVDWKPQPGIYNIQARITNTNPNDENLDNNQAIRKNIFVDSDSNNNSIGDSKEQNSNIQSVVVVPDQQYSQSQADIQPENSDSSTQEDPIIIQSIKSGFTNILEKLSGKTTNESTPLVVNNISNTTNTKEEENIKMEGTASFADSVADFLKKGDNAIYFVIGTPIALLILLLLFRKKKTRKTRTK